MPTKRTKSQTPPWQFPLAVILYVAGHTTVKVNDVVYCTPSDTTTLVLNLLVVLLMVWLLLVTLYDYLGECSNVEEEESMIVKFNGFKLDLFVVEGGAMGITAELEDQEEGPDEDRPSRDIFIDHNLQTTVM